MKEEIIKRLKEEYRDSQLSMADFLAGSRMNDNDYDLSYKEAFEIYTELMEWAESMQCKDFRVMVDKSKNEIISAIKKILEENGNYADFRNGSYNCPIARQGSDDYDTFTVDYVSLFTMNDGTEKVTVDFSSSAENDCARAEHLDIECLLDILEEMETNEDLYLDYED